MHAELLAKIIEENIVVATAQRLNGQPPKADIEYMTVNTLSISFKITLC